LASRRAAPPGLSQVYTWPRVMRSRTALATQITRTPAVSGPSPTISARYPGLNLEHRAPRAAAGLMQSSRNKASAGTLIAARGSVTANSSFEVQATSWALIRTVVYEAWMRDTC